MKKIVLLLLPLLISLCCGCASTYGLTEEQQLQAIEKYPRGGLNIEPSDDGFITTMKITGRVLICPLTFGISELALLEDREASFRKYADYLYYNSFLGKPCAAVIQAFGAPTRLTTDGKGGNIYVWEKTYATGGTSYPVTTYYNNVPHTTYHSTPLRFHKNIKEFYFTSDDKCYHWRVATE